MGFPSWLHSLKARFAPQRSTRPRRKARNARACVRPQLEELEDRTLLSYTINEFALPMADSRPDHIAAGPDGNVWFNEFNRNTLAKITPGGQITELPPISSLLNIASFVFGPDGNIWLGCRTDIAEITPQGVLLHDYVIPSASHPGTSETGLILTMGPDGNIWYVEPYTNDLIGRLTPGGQITEFHIGFDAAGAADIINGPDGNLWIEQTDANAIGRIHLDGTIDIFSLFAAPVNNAPRGLTAGPDGNLWMTLAAQTAGGVDQILRVNTAGQLTGQFNVPTLNSHAYGMTVGSDGAIWFAEINGNQIGRITVDGVITEYPIPTPNSGSGLLTSGPDGNIWFNESYANQIGEVVLTVTAATPAIGTTPSAGGTVGISVFDTATVSDGYSPTGNVTFNLFGPSDSTCSATPLYADTETLSGGTATSGSYATAAVGTYHWVATYNGDANNKSVSSNCADEPVTTIKASPALVTTAYFKSSAVGGNVVNIAVPEDSAALSGGYMVAAGSPAPTITFTLYAPSNIVAYTETDTVTGTGTYTTHNTNVATQVGTYTWKVSYSGNALNNGAVDQGGAAEQLKTIALHKTGTARTMGFWGSTQAVKPLTAMYSTNFVNSLNADDFRNADGTIHAFLSSSATNFIKDLQSWLNNSSATNMANQLSAQLLATVFNVQAGFLSTSSYVYVGGIQLNSYLNTGSPGLVNSNGFAKIGDLINAAIKEIQTPNSGTKLIVLSGNPRRNFEEALKNVFDAINSDSSIFIL